MSYHSTKKIINNPDDKIKVKWIGVTDSNSTEKLFDNKKYYDKSKLLQNGVRH